MAPLVNTLLGAALVAVCAAVPAQNARANVFTYYNLTTPLASPCDLNTGPDGNIYASTFTSNKLVEIDITQPNPVLTEINIPFKSKALPFSVLPPGLQGVGSCVIQPGADGNVYYATGIRNELVQYNPKTKKFAFFENSGGLLGNAQPFNDAWPAATGLWFTQTTANLLTFFNYKTHQMTSYDVPTPLSSPVGVIIVPNGDVWVCEFVGQKMARFTPSTKTWKEYPVPATLLGPAVVRAFTGGKYIWFTAITTNAIGRLDITTGDMVAYPDIANVGVPIEDTNDGKGNVWFSTALSNTLNYITPSTGKITSIPQPDSGVTSTPVSLPPVANIAIHWNKGDNSIWFTQLVANRIGRYTLSRNQ